MVYEKEEGKIYYDEVNEVIKRSRDWFINVGCRKQVRNKSEISETVVAKLLNCDINIINIYIKYGVLRSDDVNGKHYFSYEWIEDFARDNRFLDECGNVPEKTGYDSTFYTDDLGRQIVIPVIKWIDKNGKETDKPNPKSPPNRYVQLICINGKKQRHTMGVGGRAEGYYLMPLKEDIKLIKKYKLELGEQYKSLYLDK